MMAHDKIHLSNFLEKQNLLGVKLLINKNKNK
jgi:hypothetical protein